MKILKGLVKIFSILFGLFVIIITIAVMGESYKIINQNKGDNYVRVEVKKLCGYAHDPSDIAWGPAGIRFEEGQLSE
jgi:hypothetical protein